MWSLCVLLTACNAQIASGPPTQITDAQAVGSAPDASAQPPPPDAAPLGPWSAPAKITVAAVAGRDDDDETLSANSLEMIFAVNGKNGKDLFYTQRATAASTDWSAPVKMAFTVDGDQTPRLSADDLTLYFSSPRATTDGTLDIWQVTRDTAGTDVWKTPTKLTTVSSAVTEKWYMPCPIKGSPDYIMVKDQGGTKGTHLVESTTGGAATEIATLVGPDGTSETGTFLTNDCLTLYFASTRATPSMIYISHRTAIGSPWSAPKPVVDYPLTGTDNQEDPWMASDLRTFVFVSNAGGDKDVYISTR
jgi:hypothetical protein